MGELCRLNRGQQRVWVVVRGYWTNPTQTARKKAFRIPNARPDGSRGGVFEIPRTNTGQPSYVSDIITVDFDVETSGNKAS